MIPNSFRGISEFYMSQFFVLNIAAAAFFIGFFISDVILSRAVFAVGAAVFVYGFTLNEGNFLALVWAMIFLLTNLGVIWLTLQRRHAVPLSDEAKALAKEMPQFSKKDFARLMQICDWQTLNAEQKLTEQGAPVEVGADLLIGEISLTQKVPATATVHAHKGSVLVAWPVKKLNKLLKRKSLKAGFDALLSHDLAEKLAADEFREQD
jgi:hypothetical protein